MIIQHIEGKLLTLILNGNYCGTQWLSKYLVLQGYRLNFLARSKLGLENKMIGGPAQNKRAQDSVENSTHFNTIANLLIVEVRDAQNLYSLIIYHYKQYSQTCLKQAVKG